MIGRDHFYLRVAYEDTQAEILSSFLKQFYAGTPFIPRNGDASSVEIEDAQVLEEWLSARRGGRVYLRTPKKGEKEKLVELARTNAQMVLATG